MGIHVVKVEANKQSEPFGVDGQFIYVENSQGTFDLKVADKTPVPLKRFEHVDLIEKKQQNRICRITDTTGIDQEIVLISSDFKLLKRTTSEIAGSIVGIAAGSQIEIDPNQNIVRLPSSQIADLIQAISDSSDVSVVDPVTISAGQITQLIQSINNSANVSITNPVQLNTAQLTQLIQAINSSATVTVNDPVQILAAQISQLIDGINPALNYNPLPRIVIGTTSAVVPANPDRVKLLVSCPNANTGNVVFAGANANEGTWIKKNVAQIEIEGSNAVTFQGNNGNEIYLAEIVRA